MAPTIPVGEPRSVRAGDSWIWKQSFPEYPASEGWTLSYAFRGIGQLNTLSAEVTHDGGSAYTVTIPSARTAIDAGSYQWSASMTGSGTYAGRRDTVATGTLEVQVDVATATAETLQPQAEKLLAAIDAVLYGRITDDVQAVTIAGRAVTKIPITELLSIKARLKREVQQLRNPGVVAGAVRMAFR